MQPSRSSRLLRSTATRCVKPERLDRGAIYPDPSDLREVRRKIACGVMREARRQNLGRIIPDDAIERKVESSMWYPNYVDYLPPA